MYNAISGAGGLSTRRSFRKSGSTKISASMGVRNGFVADVERPLPEGLEPNRHARRIPAALRVYIAGEWRRVSGDVSSGGVLVLFPQMLEGPVHVVIELRDGSGRWQATGDILRVETRGRQYAHHVRFAQPSELNGLDAIIQKHLASGETRLETA